MLNLLYEVLEIYVSKTHPSPLEKDSTQYKKAFNGAITQLAKDLNLARGTIKRWMDLEAVPDQYQFDLLKKTGKTIDYSRFSSKDKDQFFTPAQTAQYCYESFCNTLQKLGVDEEDYHYIEPSAGDGAFLRVLPPARTIGVDIEPQGPDIICHDYLTWKPEEEKNYVVFGNPPFGLRGHLALQFINHSAQFADYVCFILPQLFESDGKGAPRKRVEGYNLIHSEKLNTNFYDPSGRQMKINVVFQIWSKDYSNDKYKIKSYADSTTKVYSLSNGSSPSQQRNTHMLESCDVYIPSTCFGADKMCCYNSFNELPGGKGYGVVFEKDKEAMLRKAHSLDWSQISFLSTNSAYNLRTSMILEALA